MTTLHVNPVFCKGCGICIDACPKNALRSSGRINARGYILPEADDMTRCTECGMCEIVCPDFAIAIEPGGKKEKPMGETKAGKNIQPFATLHHLSVVVRDLDASVAFYESIGFGPFVDYPPMQEYVHIDVPDEEGFYDLKIKCARMGPVQLQLIQPGKGASLYKDHLEEKGEGVYHLGFVVDHLDEAETAVKDLGIGVKSRGRRTDGSGFAYLDTTEKGGVTLLVRQSPPEK